jgi:ketosteroid isomerase-like protein
MPPCNTDLVRRAFEAWRALDVEAAGSLFAPAVRWHVAEDEPDARVAEGVPAVIELLRGWAESFDDLRAEPREFIDCGDCVVVPVAFRGRARQTAATLEIEEAQVYLVRDGRIAAVQVFRRLEDALAAAAGGGLSR